MSTLSRGPHTLEIPVELFKDNRTKLVTELKAQNARVQNNPGVYVLLQGKFS
jgi:hypothetical protein